MTGTKQKELIDALQNTLDAFIDRFLESNDYIKKKITIDVFMASVERLCAQLPPSFAGPLKKHAFARIDAAQATSVLADMQHRIANGDLLPAVGTVYSAPLSEPLKELYRSFHEHAYAQAELEKAWRHEALLNRQNDSKLKQQNEQRTIADMYNQPYKHNKWT